MNEHAQSNMFLTPWVIASPSCPKCAAWTAQFDSDSYMKICSPSNIPSMLVNMMLKLNVRVRTSRVTSTTPVSRQRQQICIVHVGKRQPELVRWIFKTTSKFARLQTICCREPNLNRNRIPRTPVYYTSPKPYSNMIYTDLPESTSNVIYISQA